VDINEIVMKIHEDLIDFGSKVEAASVRKLDSSSHLPKLVYGALCKKCAYAIRLHRAGLCLCEAGWTPITTILLRTVMECAANCLAIINNECPEYMAFKYFYHPIMQIKLDEGYPMEKRNKADIDLRQGVQSLGDEAAKQKATQFMEKDRIKVFWFRPEENGVSAIIKKYGSVELKHVYSTLSMSTHAGHLGMVLFQDNPDEITIEPSHNPVKELLSLVMSCRLVLELLEIRNNYEGLGFEVDYQDFLYRIIATEDAVRSLILP